MAQFSLPISILYSASSLFNLFFPQKPNSFLGFWLYPKTSCVLFPPVQQLWCSRWFTRPFPHREEGQDQWIHTRSYLRGMFSAVTGLISLSRTLSLDWIWPLGKSRCSCLPKGKWVFSISLQNNCSFYRICQPIFILVTVVSLHAYGPFIHGCVLASAPQIEFATHRLLCAIAHEELVSLWFHVRMSQWT